jgi:putative lipoprotein
VVTGTVTYLERIAMPPNALVTVRLLDESKTGARDVALGEVAFFTAGKQPPYPFVIDYGPDRIEPEGRYTIEAMITVDGRLRYRTAEGYPVITNGVTSVDVVVEPFG